jgi:predicted chitinase
MSFELQQGHLAELIPGNKDVDAWYEALVAVMPKYGINTARRAAHFISQCAHESNNFRSLSENLVQAEQNAMQQNMLVIQKRLQTMYTWTSSVNTKWAMLMKVTVGCSADVD